MRGVFYIVMLLVALFFTSCADAGKDQEVKSGAIVTLDASKSEPDVSGKITKYRWKQVKGTKVKLSDKKSVNPTFTAPNVEKKTKLVFRLKTVEKDGQISPWRSKDKVAIFVTPKTTTQIPPVAKISVSSTEIKEGESITFDANASSDEDGQIVNYEWLDKNNEILSSQKSFVHLFTSVGEHTVTLNVTDNDGLVGTGSQTILVEALSLDTTPPIITLNGDGNITLTQGSEYVELGVNSIDDVDGNVSVSVSGSVDTATVGTYTLTYTAKDSANNAASKTRTVNVIPVIIVDTIPPIITIPIYTTPKLKKIV